MRRLERSIKKRYIFFIATITLIIIAVLTAIQSNVKDQKNDAYLINKSGKQCALSQRIAKIAFSLDNNMDDVLRVNYLSSLKTSTDEFEKTHNDLRLENQKYNTTIDSLLEAAEPYLENIIVSSRNIVNQIGANPINQDVVNIAEAESSYLMIMGAVVNEHQLASENRVQRLIQTIYLLAFVAVLIFVGEYLFVLAPALKHLLLQNDKYLQANDELFKSESTIKEHVSELKELSADKEAYNKIFIEQAPTAISMLDNNMCYIAVSQQWVTDYKMEGQEIIGRSHYDLFPEIGEDWKANHRKCLNGAIDTCDEAPFTRADGSVQWIYWDVRPWYISKGNIGGLIMHTGDITDLKEKEEEKIRIEKILDKTNEVARIGTWDIDLINNGIFWSRVVREIHEVPEDFEPDLETAINFFKEGESRDTIEKVVNEAIEHGTPYDVEIELVTFKGNILWTRAIGQAEIVDGRCVRLFGVFQDVNEKKLSQLALSKAHSELQAIFSSESIAIVTTDGEGVINRFNHGAEILTGYSASEMIGLQKPYVYHLEEELEKFTNDIAKRYDKDPLGFNPQLELSKQNEYDTREWIYVRKDGSTLPVQLTLTGIKDEEGKDIGFLGVSTDVSGRRITQDKLLRKNQLLNFAEEITLMGNWQWDIVTDTMQWSNNIYNILQIDKGVNHLNFDTYFKVVHPEDTEIVTEYFKNAAEEKELSIFSHRIITKDGKLKIIQILGKVISNNKGEVIEMIGTCQDVTEQRMAENKFRGLLESAPDAMVIVNEKGEIQLINKQSERLFGYSADELFGKTVETLIPNRFVGDHAEHRNGFFASPKVRAMGVGGGKELFGVTKEGKEIPIQISLSPLQTEEGLLVSAAIRDITEQKMAESELLRKNQLLNFAEEITAMGHWQWDTVDDKVQWSNNLYKMFELDSSTTNLSFNTYFNFVHPEDQDIVTEYFDNAAKEKKFSSFTHRIVTTTGKIKTVQLLGEVIVNDKGDVIEMIGTCQDVTVQRMAENKFRGLLESAPDAMVIFNESYSIELVNSGVEKIFGYSRSELIGKPADILFAKSSVPNPFQSQMKSMGQSKTVKLGVDSDILAVKKDGTKFPVEINLGTLKTDDELLISAAIRDITRRKETEVKLRSIAALQAKNEEMEQLSYITSHDLKEPLLTIKKYSQVLQDECQTMGEKEEFVLGAIIRSADRMETKIKDLLEYSQLGYGHKFEVIDCAETLKTVIEDLNSLIEANRAEIVIGNLPAKVTAYSTGLQLIFQNLINNAIKFRKKDIVPKVSISSKKKKGGWEFVFEDNGIGIDEKDFNKIFSIFKRLHNHSDYTGSGVGLAHVKKLVELHNGQVWVKSKPGKGTVFHFSIITETL
ncbi:MAG: PAS domain S-box protein [Cyclobacteriaceae bacterium]